MNSPRTPTSWNVTSISRSDCDYETRLGPVLQIRFRFHCGCRRVLDCVKIWIGVPASGYQASGNGSMIGDADCANDGALGSENVTDDARRNHRLLLRHDDHWSCEWAKRGVRSGPSVRGAPCRLACDHPWPPVRPRHHVCHRS